MAKFDVKPSQSKKVRSSVAVEAADLPEKVEMIVKVKEDDYVPAGVNVRARVDATMFTAEASPSLIARLEHDPKVRSVAVSRPLRIIG
jgi:hypothetical protein